MDPRLLRAYNYELGFLRESAREFGLEHEVVAGYLGLNTPNNPDPYVERLLEGVAFLAARVHLKLTDQFPEFTQHLLQAVQPGYLAPTPSICIAELTPHDGDEALAKGAMVPRKSSLLGKAVGHDTPVTFRTGHAVELLPLEVAEVAYLPTRAAAAVYAAAAGVRADAALRIRFRCTAGVLSDMAQTLLADAEAQQRPRPVLPIHLTGPEMIPGELYRQLLGDAVAVVAMSDGDRPTVVRGLPIPSPYGFSDDCALLPKELRTFRGYRILTEYFACPERFLFAGLGELERAFAVSQSHCDVVVLLKRSCPALIDAITADNVRLFCTPAINLFEQRLTRSPVSRFDHEHHIVPDKTRPHDYEVVHVLDVTAHPRGGPPRTAFPLYALGSSLSDPDRPVFYTTRLAPRRLSARERQQRNPRQLRQRVDYIGTETFVSLTCPAAPDLLDDVQELSVTALMSNRELPELLARSELQSDLEISHASVRRVSIVRAPTRPRPPQQFQELQQQDPQDASWRTIAHLTPNYSTLIGADDGSPDLLRNHLALYGWQDDPVLRSQINGIVSVRSRNVTRRVSGVHRLAFGRGQEATVTLDDRSYENGRMFLFAAILDRFLSEFVSINSFVETVFRSHGEGEFVRWPARTGARPTI